MIIFLNGPSSAGKSSVAKALQQQYSTPLLVIGIDAFLSMMPKEYLFDGNRANEGFQFISEKDAEGNDVTRITVGEYGKKVCAVVPNIIRTMQESGLDIIVDEVLLGDESLKQYVQTLHQCSVYFVGVHCELNEIENREKARGNRFLGLGRDQMDRVHAPTRIYDLKIDTTDLSPNNAAGQIITFIQNHPEPTGFKQLYSIFFPEEEENAPSSSKRRRIFS